MAEKVSTLVVTLNHDGRRRRFTKIRKAICKLQETEDIRAISYDEVSGTVTISGAFDPLVLPCKLRRKAGCLIKHIQLVAAELRLTPQRLAQRPAAMLLPNPSGLALPPSCCCGVCGCAGYGYCYGCSYYGCQAWSCSVNHSPWCYGLPLGQYQYPKMEVIACEESSSPVCMIM